MLIDKSQKEIQMNQIIMLKVMERIVLVAFVFCVGKSAFAQQSMSSSDSKPKKYNSVRKAEMTIVGTDNEKHTAYAHQYHTRDEVTSSVDDRVGIQYYPSQGDKGKAILKERKFKWGAYYYLYTESNYRAPLDRFNHVHAIAAVAGEGFPTTFQQQSGSKDTQVSISFGPMSIEMLHFDINPNPKTDSGTIPHTYSNQTPINESAPIIESLYHWIGGGYALADVDPGVGSKLTAIAKYQYYTLPASDPRQFSTQEAFYYPFSIR
jgi:hypothetical protein